MSVLRLGVMVLVVGCGAPMPTPPVDSGVEMVVDAGLKPLDGGRADSGVRDGGGGIDAGPGAVDAGPIVDPGGCLRTPAYNRVVNAGFECALTTWSVAMGTGSAIDGGHSGAKALVLVANAQGEALVGANDVVPDSEGQVYCARAWVRGSSPEMRLEVRPTPSGKGSAFSSPVASTDWVSVPPGDMMRVTTPRGETLSILVKMQGAAAGDTLEVDDVELWPSASGRCDDH